MEEAGFISVSEQQQAEAIPLQLKPAEPKFLDSRAPYFSSWVQQELPKVLSPEQLEVGGLTVRSSVNLAWQEKAQSAVNTYATGSMQGALVAMEPGTGLVRAMVGGTNFKNSQFNRAAQALRSPGSTFKLFVYLTALQQGMLPERLFRDSARCFAGYCPKNFGNRYLGSASMVVALQNSLNTVAVGLLKELGFDKVIETAKSLGITRELGRFYPLALGATEQTVVDMTAAYAAINNGGIYVKPTPFEEILGPDGELLWSRRVDGDQGRRAVNSDVATLMLWMLERAVRSGTGGGAALPDRPVGGKTGTSEGGRDLWFIGSIPQLTTGVWLGYDDSRNTKNTSVIATYAWRAFMAPISKDLPVRQFPPKPQLADTYQLDKKQTERRSEPAPSAESWRETAPQALELDPTPSFNEQPYIPAAPVSPAAGISPAPLTPLPLEAPPPPLVAPPPPP